MNSIINSHGGNLRIEAQRLGFKEDDLLDASASLVPFPPPNEINRLLVKIISTKSLNRYPDTEHISLKEAIANKHNILPNMVLPGNGAAELFTWAARDASKEGVSALPAPCFSDYERALQCWDAKYIYLPIPLSWSTDKPQSFPLRSKANVIWITNPHNPTGQLWTQESLEPLLHSHNLVICDEAFLPLVPNGEIQSLIPLSKRYSNLIVIRSLTKLFGLPGLRLGYAISMPERLVKWQQWRDPWPMNTFAIATGTSMMRNQRSFNNWLKKVHQWVSIEGSWLFKKLNDLPLIKPYPSSTNYLLIKSDVSLTEVREKLANKKIILRDCRSFKELGDNWLRISLKTRQENQKIISKLKEILNKLPNKTY